MRKGGGILAFALHLMLCLSMTFWSLNSATRHNPAQVFEQTIKSAEAAEHGHSHGEALDLIWSMHGHAHDAADHDHNSALTPAPVRLALQPMPRQHAPLTDRAAPPPPSFGFERPPRVLLL